MDKNLTDVAIDRLDVLCNFFHALGGGDPADKWPDDLRRVAEHLAGELERLAGALDQVDNNRAALRELIGDAQRQLPQAFAAFGTAVSQDLANAFLRASIA